MCLEELNIQSFNNPLHIRSYNPTTSAIYETTSSGERIVYTGEYYDCVSMMRDIEKYMLKVEEG